MKAVIYRQLMPSGEDTDAGAFVSALALADAEADARRPYTIVNFVASVDGHATIDGRSRGLGDDGDRGIFRALRERADAVLVGTGTLAAEDYGRMIVQQDRRERRLAAGRPAEPLVVTVARSSRVPLGIRLFQEPEARVVVFSPRPPDATAASVTHEPWVSLASSLRTLRDRHGVRTLLCEGGPTLFGALLRDRLVDELFLTLAPKLVGGTSGPAVVSGPPPEAPVSARLASVLERDGSLFLRYRL